MVAIPYDFLLSAFVEFESIILNLTFIRIQGEFVRINGNLMLNKYFYHFCTDKNKKNFLSDLLSSISYFEAFLQFPAEKSFPLSDRPKISVVLRNRGY